jgi:AcrR family transcriptional regulator
VPANRIQLSQETLRAAIGDEWAPEQVDAAVELLVSSEGKFPSGVRKLPPELIRAVQRERLLAAMLKAVSELGYRQANVQHVIERAGVSRPTFYEHFANKEDCFLAAFETSAARLRNDVSAAADRAGADWRNQVRFGLETLLTFMSSEPEAAQTLVVEARAASADAVLQRDQLLGHFSTCIDRRVRQLLPDAAVASTVTSLGIVGGVEATLYSRLNRGQWEDLGSLLPSLMYFVVLSYEGHEAANEVRAMAPL